MNKPYNNLEEKTPNMRIYLAQMCEKFTDTFKKMKDLRQMRSSLESENNRIHLILTEESQKLESTLSKLKEDLSKIQEKQDELIKKSTDFQRQILALSNEKTQKQTKLQIIQDENALLRKESKGEGLEITRNLENSIINLKEKLDEMKNLNELSIKKENVAKNQLEEVKKTKENKEQELKELEAVYKGLERNSMEKVVQDHEIVNNYRRNLKENREKMEIIERKEKDLEILSEELESKLDRLKTIIGNNKSMKAKMNKNDDNLFIYQQLSQENQGLRQEINDLKARISDLQPKNYNRNEKNHNQSYMKNIKVLDMNLQKERNKELKEKIEKMQKILEEKEKEYVEIKREGLFLKEKKEDLNKDYQGDDEKNKKLAEYYEKLSENLETVREKLQDLL